MRFVLALLVSFALYDASFSSAMAAGDATLGGWGMAVAVLVLGFGLALLFTAVYDGPVATVRLFTTRRDR